LQANHIYLWLALAGVECPANDTGAYSKARQRLPEGVLQCLVPEVAKSLEQQVPSTQQWCGQRVRVCDGTTVLMSDTSANQAEYPQHGNQTPGCGFPIAKLVVMFSLVTGAVVSACIAPWGCREIVMSRLLYQNLEPEDLEQVATDLLPLRPPRSEPRVVKRRPKPFPRMRQPRSVLKAKLAE
jgi:hypothetical protein